MPSPPPLYRALVRALRPLLPLAAPFSPKLELGLAGRRQSALALAQRPRDQRQNSGPLILFHAASAGELRQAEPVLLRLRQRHPDWQFALTWSSPSGEAVGRSLPVELAGYAPWDLSADVATFLDQLRPDAIVVSKLDLWPEFAAAAHYRAIPLGLIAASVRPGSGRLRWPARTLLQSTYAALDLIGAISEGDRQRLTQLGAQPDRISLVGDPRADAVMSRIQGVRPAERWPELTTGGLLLVAGSTWPRDENRLLAAFRLVRQEVPHARLLLAPHEPTTGHLRRLTAAAQATGLPTPVPLDLARSTDPLLLLDRVGELALLYGIGDLAYVGGGFGRAGLHSVLEPAAWGLPVIVGPNWADQRDATLLQAAGGLRPLRAHAGDAGLTAAWLDWLMADDKRRAAGGAARRVVEGESGAADRCADLVERLLRR